MADVTEFKSYGVPVEITTTPDTVNISLDNLRRTFALTSDKLAELTPNKTPFFTYLAKMRNESTTDPIFKKMEVRPQWQRRNFRCVGSEDISSVHERFTFNVATNYTRTGRKTATYVNPARFLLPEQVISLGPVTITASNVSDAEVTPPITAGTLNGTIFSVEHSSAYTTIVLTPLSTMIAGSSNTDTPWLDAGTDGYDTMVTLDSARTSATLGQVIGTAFDEGSTYPTSWHDDITSTEGYAQIFKTACPLFTGTSLATEYRAKSNEFMRVWDNKLNEHKMDIETAMMFGIGRVETTSSQPVGDGGATGRRYTWGIIPYLNRFGFSDSSADGNAFDASADGYDSFLDWMEEFTSPEDANDGSKLVLCSRKILKYFNHLGDAGFLDNTLSNTNAGRSNADIQNYDGAFGHAITKVSTIFGDLHFMEHPLLRGNSDNLAAVVDLRDVKYRPLVGNGISRDTFIQTNVQNPGVDGRVDQIITEAGLEFCLPERSALLRFSSLR